MSIPCITLGYAPTFVHCTVYIHRAFICNDIFVCNITITITSNNNPYNRHHLPSSHMMCGITSTETSSTIIILLYYHNCFSHYDGYTNYQIIIAFLLYFLQSNPFHYTSISMSMILFKFPINMTKTRKRQKNHHSAKSVYDWWLGCYILLCWYECTTFQNYNHATSCLALLLGNCTTLYDTNCYYNCQSVLPVFNVPMCKINFGFVFGVASVVVIVIVSSVKWLSSRWR